jgi:hypothetical protein
MRALLTGASTLVIWGGVCAASAGAAFAQEPEEDERGVDVHGFVSQGFIKTTSNNYLAESKRGSFDFTEVGINFTTALSDRLRVGLQLFAHDLGPLGNYRPQFDWFYLDYRFLDELGIRVGRTKLPFGLYNETNDIDAARVPILLPQSVYPVQNRDFLLAQTGAEVYGLLPIGAAGDLEYRLYGGTIFLDLTDNEQINSLEVPYLFGGRLMWMPPLDGLQLGGSLQSLRLDFELQLEPEQIQQLEAIGAVPPSFDGTATAELPALLWVASVEYSAHELLLAAEYSRWRSEINESSLPILFPEETTVSERFYVMASYRVAPWFTPGIYYSVHYPDVDDRSGRDKKQQDLALSFRYDLNENWLFKVEGHYMHGTAGLRSALNDGAKLDALREDWGVLLLKTTAYF